MSHINWAQRAFHSEVAYSAALGSEPSVHAGFIHLTNEVVPWGGDFNCALRVQLTDWQSFVRVRGRVEELHRQRGLDRPDRYDIYPLPLDEAAWQPALKREGYDLDRLVWFSAPTRETTLPPGIRLYTPDPDDHIAWYHERQKKSAWYDAADWERLRPLQEAFARVFVPYWMFRDEVHVGWVYCGYLGAYGSLSDVWIEPEYRGQGLGRMLLDAIRLEGCRQGVEHLILRTSASRRPFYEKCGFRECLQSSSIRLRRGAGS